MARFAVIIEGQGVFRHWRVERAVDAEGAAQAALDILPPEPRSRPLTFAVIAFEDDVLWFQSKPSKVVLKAMDTPEQTG